MVLTGPDAHLPDLGPFMLGPVPPASCTCPRKHARWLVRNLVQSPLPLLDPLFASLLPSPLPRPVFLSLIFVLQSFAQATISEVRKRMDANICLQTVVTQATGGGGVEQHSKRSGISTKHVELL